MAGHLDLSSSWARAVQGGEITFGQNGVNKRDADEKRPTHNQDVAAFKRESTSAKDPELKAWAGKAEDVQAKVGKSSADKTETTPKQ